MSNTTSSLNLHNDYDAKTSACWVKHLSIRPVWSESSLCAQWVAKDPSFLHADSEDSDQTGQMPRLIWVFAGRTCYFVGFVMRRLIWNYTVASVFFTMTLQPSERLIKFYQIDDSQT